MLQSASGGTSGSLSYDPSSRLYQLTAGANTTIAARTPVPQTGEHRDRL